MGFTYIQHLSRICTLKNIYPDMMGKITEARVIIIIIIIIFSEWFACIVDYMNSEVCHGNPPQAETPWISIVLAESMPTRPELLALKTVNVIILAKTNRYTLARL